MPRASRRPDPDPPVAGSEAAGAMPAPPAADDFADPAAAGSADAIASEATIAAELNFREAQTALELSLVQLQDPDLDVEAMAGLYRRARLYADRCEQLLSQVEQEIVLWDPQQPEQQARPYVP